jgi:uncharacterized membrane protein (DUF4010 family)
LQIVKGNKKAAGEMFGYQAQDFTVATDVKVYFCDPQSPWQRGTNENTNLLVRQYFPRKSDLSSHMQSDLDKVALCLNQRPRKILGFQTPAIKLRASVALTCEDRRPYRTSRTTPAQLLATSYTAAMLWQQADTALRIPTPTIAVQLAASLCIGMLVGIEREWANKEFGLRSFAFIAVLGMLSAHLPVALAAVAFVGVLLLIAASDVRNYLANRPLELTTSIAVLLVFVAGYLVGSGHVFTPVASAIIITMLLAWKLELRKFAGGLTLEEIRSAVLLELLGFVIYPVIPNRFVDPWQLMNPRTAWVMVIVIAGIGFVNYVLLKLYGTRGIYVSGFLGGLVNSTAAAAELARPLGAGSTSLGVAIAALLLTIVAMFARNLIIVAIFSPAALATAAAPLIAMALGALLLVWRSRPRARDAATEIHLVSPVSLPHVLKFAVLFLVIQVVSTLGERHLGKFGFLGISLLGGLVSSASTTAAASNMVANGQLQPGLAGTGVVLASIASALINLPIVARGAKNATLTPRLVTLTVALATLGVLVLILREHHWLLKI